MKCDCTFREVVNETHVLCPVKKAMAGSNWDTIGCTPETCSYWQDHLLIESIQNVLPDLGPAIQAELRRLQSD